VRGDGARKKRIARGDSSGGAYLVKIYSDNTNITVRKTPLQIIFKLKKSFTI
jgi:hypothetical protein